MTEDTRYWKRMGMRVTKQFALEAATKMQAAASYHDDESFEFVQVSFDTISAEREVETLFSRPDTDSDAFDGANQVLIEAMKLHKKRGRKIKQLRKKARTTVLESDDLKSLEDYIIEMADRGYGEVEANKQYEQDLQSKIVSEAEQRYQEWYDVEVVELQKKYGVYKDPEDDDYDEEE
tara:strand:- start:549 stop:1082 length:534 start_codon:yes stop_codon:yes gene_type:complete